MCQTLLAYWCNESAEHLHDKRAEMTNSMPFWLGRPLSPQATCTAPRTCTLKEMQVHCHPFKGCQHRSDLNPFNIINLQKGSAAALEDIWSNGPEQWEIDSTIPLWASFVSDSLPPGLGSPTHHPKHRKAVEFETTLRVQKAGVMQMLYCVETGNQQ